MTTPTKKPKHVIFLGAGASASSGYPLANDLRLWMATPEAIRTRTFNELDKLSIPSDLAQQFTNWIEPLSDFLKLFRDGGFATVDEFCRLAQGQSRFSVETKALKKVLRLVLSIHNPEDHFEKSDYYRFVQRLFQSNLVDLRPDIVVLSFNYDVYLEFLLLRASKIRAKIKDARLEHDPDMLTSGFYNRNIQSLETSDDFCFLKLHGSIAWPMSGGFRGTRGPYCCYSDLFEERTSRRLDLLCSANIGLSEPPIVFPWEIMNDDGNFIEEAAFPCQDHQNRAGYFPGGHAGGTNLLQLFRAIWSRARSEVLAADKISVVGLSMHEYLQPAFKFLFQGKEGNIELVVADKRLENYSNNPGNNPHFDPLSPVARVAQLLHSICPDLRWNEPPTLLGIPRSPVLDEIRLKHSVRPIRGRSSFEDFILNELDERPVSQFVIES